MNNTFRSLLALLALLPAALFAQDQPADPSRNCGCACCKGEEVCCCQAGKAAGAEAKPADSPRYPLTGVVKDVLTAKGALLVKHEAIPGYMKAMTMMFKVDAATLQAATPGQAITGTLVKRDGEFWLEDVTAVPAK
jgi:Cu/Ag efflux protein CusF